MTYKVSTTLLMNLKRPQPYWPWLRLADGRAGRRDSRFVGPDPAGIRELNPADPIKLNTAWLAEHAARTRTASEAARLQTTRVVLTLTTELERLRHLEAAWVKPSPPAPDIVVGARSGWPSDWAAEGEAGSRDARATGDQWRLNSRADQAASDAAELSMALLRIWEALQHRTYRLRHINQRRTAHYLSAVSRSAGRIVTVSGSAAGPDWSNTDCPWTEKK